MIDPDRPDRPVRPAGTSRPARPRVLLADRGDALTAYLTQAVREQCTVVGHHDVDLTALERLLVAVSTFRPHRRDWVERFFKSELGMQLRSTRANRAVRRTPEPFDIVLQTHALFTIDDPRTVLYVDCTHRQSAEHWPDWNPLRGAALGRWVERERKQYHRAAHVFAFSQPTRASLVDDYGVPADRVTVVGAGANVDPLPVPPTTLDAGAPVVLFIGNDFVRKGGDLLLAAFRLVRERVPEARLLLVGTSYAIPQEGLPDGAEVLGRIDDRDRMSELFAQATVLAVPSVFDPYPLVVLEAMAHAVPVVATRECGIPEMVEDGETGRLVDLGPDTVAQLADALVALLADPREARRLGLAGRRLVEQKFLWSHVVDRMVEALDLPRTTPTTGTTTLSQGARS